MKNNDFISLSSDFGFKRFMKNKDNVLEFLNSILPIEVTEIKITREPTSAPVSRTNSDIQLSRKLSHNDITSTDQEEFGDLPGDKSIRYDYTCETSTGTQINVEMQKAKQPYYYHRAVFYSSRLISRQGHAGKNKEGKGWDWKLNPTYHIGIVNFSVTEMLDVPHEGSWLLWSSLAINESKCIPPIISTESKFHSDALNIVIISLPDFDSQVPKLDLLNSNSNLNKFIWLFSNLGTNMEAIPEWAVDNTSFKRVLDTMQSRSLTSREMTTYHAELNLQKDLNDEERYKLLERDVNNYMKSALNFTDKQTAYDKVVEEFGEDARLVLGERPDTRPDDEERNRQFERDVNNYMECALNFTDKHTAYDKAVEKFGEDARPILNGRSI